MLKSFINVIYKLKVKLNKQRFLVNPNVNVGIKFKLADYTTFIIHENSKAVFGNYIDIRNNFNLVLGENANLLIADNVFMNNNCSINCLDAICIGKNTLFGENVKLYDHNHKYDMKKVYHNEFKTAPIVIGENCWLGSNVIVLKGVSIGDNTIIGAGCVVHRDVPPNSIILNSQSNSIKEI